MSHAVCQVMLLTCLSAGHKSGNVVSQALEGSSNTHGIAELPAVYTIKKFVMPANMHG